MPQLKLCIQNQTPFVRFLSDAGPREVDFASLRRGVDYVESPGGVTRMLHALLGRLRADGLLRSARWLTLTSHGPERIRLDEALAIEQARLPPDALTRYAEAKSAVWEATHGIATAGEVPIGEVHEGLTHLARAFGRRAAALHARDPFDAFYVHDFQLLPMADHLPPDAPRVFRWHIPVRPLPAALESYVVARLNRYDAVIVSTEGYAERLREAGVRAPVHAIRPHLDETRRRVVTPDDLAAFDERWGLREDDVLFLVVARLDPMKSQDVAIRAIERIAAVQPRARLMLLGGGGFSAGRYGGLGLPHAARWREHLEGLARDLGIADRVVFTGNVSEEELEVAYTRSRAVLLPSGIEGFGLAPVEGWLYGRPAVVSRGAGVAELVEEGANGFTFAPGDVAELANHLETLARDADGAAEMGRHGRESARACHLRRGTRAVHEVLRSAIEARASGALPRGRGARLE